MSGRWCAGNGKNNKIVTRATGFLSRFFVALPLQKSETVTCENSSAYCWPLSAVCVWVPSRPETPLRRVPRVRVRRLRPTTRHRQGCGASASTIPISIFRDRPPRPDAVSWNAMTTVRRCSISPNAWGCRVWRTVGAKGRGCRRVWPISLPGRIRADIISTGCDGSSFSGFLFSIFFRRTPAAVRVGEDCMCTIFPYNKKR